MKPLLFTVSSGTGPVEVRLFVRMLAETLAREVSRRGLLIEHVITHGPVEEPSSVDLALLGTREAVNDLLGTHALVLRSDLRTKRDRKRWYAAVTCEERQDEGGVQVVLRDISFETCRAGGAGGQHVNKTESAVRAVHHPSGFSVRIESQRSQHQNKRRAVHELTQLLNAQSKVRRADAESARRARSIQVERGLYSELRQRLAPRNVIDMHIMQHLWQYVLFARRESKGKVVLTERDGWRRYELLPNGELADNTPYRGLFYVCCDTGLLRHIPAERRRRRVAP